MFGSRKKGRKHYTPPTASSVNPSAATAAVSAYNLSSAAAAAALRNLPAAPTNVGAVQTKRTMRRSASVSSEGSRRALSPVPSIKRAMGLGGNKDTREGVVVSPTGAPTLRRRGSSSSIRSMSSMTERTFRSPSPHGSRTAALSAAASASPGGSVTSNQSLSMNAAGTAAAMAAGRSTGAGSRSRSVPPPPPVPIIPKHHIDSQAKQPQQQQQQQTEKQARRATTLGLVQQPLRLASQKQKSGRSSWFGSAAVGNRADIRNSDAAMDINGYAQPERPGSRNSLQNFSYPSRQRLGSPPPSPTNTRSAAATAAVSAAAASPAAAKLPRSASTERANTQQPQQRVAAASARRSASTSRVTGRSNAGLSDQTLVYDANSRRMVPRGELLMLEQSILDAAERPQQQQRKKKQQRGTAAASLAGSHLSQGTLTHAHGTAAPLNRAELERLKEPAPQQAATVTVPAPKTTPKSPPPERQLPKIATTALEEPAAAPVREQPAVVEKDLEDTQPVPALSTSASTPSSSVSSLTALAASQAATSPVAIQNMSSPDDGSFDGTLLTEDGRPVLVKRPSIVREEPDREEEEEKQHQAGAQKPQLSDAAAVVAAANGSRAARDDLDGVSAKHIHHDSQSKAQPPAQKTPAQTQPPVAKPSEKERTRSNSPVRTAHFSPVVSSNLTVRRHSPPPRSISPRKSAMKHSSSPRDASPSDSASEANHSLQGDLALQNRKKANRVSFDDKAVVVSQSPMPPSPPHSPGLSSLPGASEAPANSNAAHQPPSRSRSWFSNIGRSKKKGSNSLDDDDVVMKPRPALPSFGSVRDKNPHQAQQQEERALVRPTVNDSQPPRQTTHSPPPPSTSTTTASAAPLETHSTSSDHAIGFIIGADRQAQTASPSAQRNTANTSRYREPLPPVVTSVDGSGYVSDSGASSDGDDEDIDVSDEEKEHSPILRFDEEQDTTVPAKLEEEEPIIPTTATAEEAEPLIILPSPSSPKSPKKAVPAIAITNPSQENLTAVRGTENDEDDEEEGETVQKADAATEDATTERSAKRNSLGAHVPGMFPADTDSDGTAKSASPTKATFVGVDPNAPVPTRGNTFEPISQEDDNSYSPQMPATVFATHMPTLHEETSLRNEKMTEDDSDSEVFSDAYEDLSDVEGDGFLSLDAVVDSPIAPDMVKSPFAPSSLPGSPSRKTEVLQLGPSPLAKETLPETESADKSTAVLTSAAAAGGAVIGMTALTSSAIHKQVNGGDPSASNGPEDEEDWEKIKAFWRSLTVEKRAQLEKEALQDAADEGDLEDESSAAKKPRRKKSVETRIAEKKAIQELAPAKAAVAPVAATKPAVAKTPAASAPPTEKQSQKTAATRMRRSMRDGAPRAGAGNVASDDNNYVASLRPNPPAQKERVATGFPPKAAVGAVSRPNVLHSRTMSADSTGSATKSGGGMAGLLPSALRRRGSDSSESSFKRARSNSNGAATGGAAAGAANFRMSMRGSGGNASDLNHRSSRFSLRSLSPTGSTTLRGSTESSPQQFRRSMRDGSGSGFGATPIDMKRMSSPGAMANSTLRKGPSDSGGGFFSSLGKKRGSKLLQRAKNEGGGMGFGGKSSRSRFGDSSDDDDDVFGTSARPSTGGGGGMAANRRSMSAGGAYTFRSRFVDSSDEDEVVPDHRILGGSKVNKDKDHVVPKTLRTGSSMRSASARPASSHTPLSPLLPEELEEEEEEKKTRSNTALNGLPATTSASAANLGVNNNNLGTSTLRRSRSGRGQIAPVSPMYSPTTTGAIGLNTGSNVTPTRRSGGIMSVLRRKKTDPISPVSGYTNGSNGNPNKIQRAALVDSAARRDTQLERSTAELAAVRSNSIGSQNRRTLNGGASGSGGSTPRFVPQNDDSDDDLDDSEDSPVATRRAATGLAGNTGRSPAAAVRMDSWPLPGPDDNNSSIGTAGGGSKGKKKFPSLRRMFRLDD